MKLIWHIIRKDFRCHRWALLLWVLLHVAQIGLGLVLLRADGTDRDWVLGLQAGSWALVFMQFTLGYTLVVQFVQADGLAGTRMFWVTRPVSARRLLAAKVLGVLLAFALLPVLLLLPWWLYNNFGAHDLWWAAVETLGWQLLMIAPAFLIASLTDEISRVFMWTLLLITGLVAWSIWMQSDLKMALGGPAPSSNSGVMFSRLWLAAVVLVIGAVIITIHQFLTRRFVRSVALTVPVLGLIVLIGRFWPWDCTILFTELNEREPEPVPTASADAFAGVQLSFGLAQVQDYNRAKWDRDKAQTWVMQTLEVQGVPEGFGIDYARSAQIWRWPDDPAGTKQSLHYSSWSDLAFRKLLSLPAGQDDPETLRWQKERRDKLNADRVAGGLPPLRPFPFRATLSGGMILTAYTPLPDSLIARIQSQPPACEVRFQCQLSRGQIMLELPLKPGAIASADSQTFRIMSIFYPLKNENATARTVLSSPALRGNGIWLATAIDSAKRDSLPESLVSVNRTEGNWGTAHLGYWEGVQLKALIGGVNIRWAYLGVSARTVIRDGEWVAHDPDWLEHTTVVMMAGKPVARLTRDLKTEKFGLEPSLPDKPLPDKSL